MGGRRDDMGDLPASTSGKPRLVPEQPDPGERHDGGEQRGGDSASAAALAQRLTAALETATIDPCEGSPGDLVGLARGSFRLEGWALWSQLAAIAALLRRWRTHPPAAADECPDRRGADREAADRRDDRNGSADAGGAMRERADAAWYRAVRRARFRMPTPAELVEECVAAEVALACGLSQSRAADRVLAADLVVLDGKLPRTARLLQAGLLDWPKIQLLTRRLGLGTDPALAGLVERTLIPDEELAAVAGLDGALHADDDVSPLPQVTRMTLPALAAAIEAAIAALDADAAAERAKAARARRCVTTRTDPDGMARIEASTGAEQVAAMWSALTAAAHQAKRCGDGRTLDQLRLDELVTRVTGLRLAQGTAGTSPRDRAGTSADSSPDPDRAAHRGMADDDRRESRWSPGTGGAAFGLTLPLTTFLEIADDPGVLDGYGPIAGALARQIARDAARLNPRTTTWRCVVVDDEHRTVLGVGRPISTPKHDPPSRLADLVRRVHPFCVFPGCRVPAARCDLDHRVGYPVGATCSCELQPLCRTHHRLKTAGLVAVRVHHDEPSDSTGGLHGRGAETGGGARAPERLIWSTSAGLAYSSRTAPATPPPPPPELQPLLDLRRDRREADRALLAWANTAVRAAYERGRRDEGVAIGRLVEEAQAAEVRHHDYGEILARSDLGPADPLPAPEPEDVVPQPPAWLAVLPLPALTDLEIDAGQIDAEVADGGRPHAVARSA